MNLIDHGEINQENLELLYRKIWGDPRENILNQNKNARDFNGHFSVND